MEFRQRLGSGGFADVFEGIYDNQPVTLKKMKTCTKNAAATLEAFEAEPRLLGLQHPHLIRLYVVSRQPDHVIIMELIAAPKTLQTLINNEALYEYPAFGFEAGEYFGHPTQPVQGHQFWLLSDSVETRPIRDAGNPGLPSARTISWTISNHES